MITAQKHIGNNVQILTKTKEQLDATVEQLKQIVIKALSEFTNTEDIQIFIMEDAKCGYCGKLVTNCLCGKPIPRPLT